ncbi:MAG: acyltransferase [Devosia sp.]|uniref:acyltransferase family protein n=1 Tax=Devosia sp. TaxID=1871048 RepID=UPI0024C84A73|nr:acyltransferase [Devosia sp.]UYO00834.1 MAG: acyltransferase [Devosia sp.]
MNQGSGTINALQGARAYAALSVLVGHAVEEVASTYGYHPPFDTAPLLGGVDIFFVISGFIIYHTTRESFGKPFALRDFVAKRLTRLVPVYWFFTTLMVLALLVAGDRINATELEPGNVLASYFFWPFERSSGRIAPILSVGWTLNYEIFFYALSALALLLPRRLVGPGVLGALAVLSIYGALAQPASPELRFWTRNLILEFGFGIVLAMAYGWIMARRNLPTSAGLVVLGLALLFALPAFFDEGPWRFLMRGVPAALIIAGCLFLPARMDSRIPAIIVLVGTASYSLYLGHRFVLRVLTIILEKLDLPVLAGSIGYTIAATIASTLMAILVYQLIEKPATRLFRSLAHQRPPDIYRDKTSAKGEA